MELNPGPSTREKDCSVRPPAINILELRLHHFGMKALDDGGAGDCFFRAVLHQLYVNPNGHGSIRVARVELLREKQKDLLKVILNIRGYNI